MTIMLFFILSNSLLVSVTGATYIILEIRLKTNNKLTVLWEPWRFPPQSNMGKAYELSSILYLALT